MPAADGRERREGGVVVVEELGLEQLAALFTNLSDKFMGILNGNRIAVPVGIALGPLR